CAQSRGGWGARGAGGGGGVGGWLAGGGGGGPPPPPHYRKAPVEPSHARLSASRVTTPDRKAAEHGLGST
ncbi:hypothetical protein EKT70_15875, partial [Stenotrophomonas geniculata]